MRNQNWTMKDGPKVAHKSNRISVGSEIRDSCGSTQRERDNLSTSLTRPDIICQELAIREGGSWECGVRATNL